MSQNNNRNVTMKYELHPLCTLFPRILDEDFLSLTQDIKTHGLREPITVHDGFILDGGNRYRACLSAGVEPVFVEFTGDSIASFVLSANLHRRHLSAGQRSAIVSSVQDWGSAHPSHRKEGCNVAPLTTVADRMAQSNASERTQQMADKVAKASPELAKQVAHGEISLPKALKQITPQKIATVHPIQPEEDPENYGPSEEEIRNAEKEAAEEIESLRRVCESDDTIKAAIDEAKRYRELARVFESRNNGLMGELAAAKRRISSLERQVAKLEKAES